MLLALSEKRKIRILSAKLTKCPLCVTFFRHAVCSPFLYIGFGTPFAQEMAESRFVRRLTAKKSINK